MRYTSSCFEGLALEPIPAARNPNRAGSIEAVHEDLLLFDLDPDCILVVELLADLGLCGRPPRSAVGRVAAGVANMSAKVAY